MQIYEKRYKLKSSDVDMNRRLRTPVLFTMLQEAAIAHTEELGMGREKTLDRGLLWIVTMQRAEIARMPGYDEEIVLRSWPGRTLHLIFPRYFSIETAAFSARALRSSRDEPAFDMTSSAGGITMKIPTATDKSMSALSITATTRILVCFFCPRTSSRVSSSCDMYSSCFMYIISLTAFMHIL